MSAQKERRNADKRQHRIVPVTLTMVGEGGEPISEDTNTVNISPHGAAVLSYLSLERGRYLQIRKGYSTKPLLASVCGWSTSPYQQKILHLQIINQERPQEDTKW